MNLLIPLETTSRELLYKTYLCNLLALKGFNCYLGNKFYINFLVKQMKSYIYLDKGYHKEVSENLYKKIKNNKGLIINLDEEGAVDYSDNSTLLGRYSEKMFAESDCVFLWGRYQYNLIKKQILDETSVFLTGHPRFDLLKKKYSFIYDDEVKKIKTKYNDFLLMNTNMGFGNNVKGDEFVKKNYGNRFSRINRMIAFDKKKRDIFTSLAIKLSFEKSYKIIFRPHPEEDKNYYLRKFSNYKNIIVNSEGSVVPWLIASKIMIHPDCTTGIESLILGKKSVSYLPSAYDSGLVTKLPLEASYQFTNESDLIDYIKEESYVNETVVHDEYKFLNDCFSLSEESSQIIVEKISKFLRRKNRGVISFSLRYRLYFAIKSFLSRISIRPSHVLSRNKLDGFDYNNILKLCSKLKRNDSSLGKINVKRITNNLFLFKKKPII